MWDCAFLFCFVLLFCFLNQDYPSLHSQGDTDSDREYGDFFYLTNWILFRKGEGSKYVRNSVKNNGQFNIQQIGCSLFSFLLLE